MGGTTLGKHFSVQRLCRRTEDERHGPANGLSRHVPKTRYYCNNRWHAFSPSEQRRPHASVCGCSATVHDLLFCLRVKQWLINTMVVLTQTVERGIVKTPISDGSERTGFPQNALLYHMLKCPTSNSCRSGRSSPTDRLPFDNGVVAPAVLGLILALLRCSGDSVVPPPALSLPSRACTSWRSSPAPFDTMRWCVHIGN